MRARNNRQSGLSLICADLFLEIGSAVQYSGENSCLAQRVTDPTESAKDQHRFVLLRKISCYFVDRVLRMRSHTIHEITPSEIKEHEIKVSCKAEDF